MSIDTYLDGLVKDMKSDVVAWQKRSLGSIWYVVHRSCGCSVIKPSFPCSEDDFPPTCKPCGSVYEQV